MTTLYCDAPLKLGVRCSSCAQIKACAAWLDLAIKAAARDMLRPSQLIGRLASEGWQRDAVRKALSRLLESGVLDVDANARVVVAR